MKNYDEIRENRKEDLQFILGGQVFNVRQLPFTIMGVWVEREDKVDASNQQEFQQMLVDRVADAVDDGNGSVDRWRALCGGPDAPSYGELLELFRWVLEVQSSLPTTAPEPSAPGVGTTAGSSRGA